MFASLLRERVIIWPNWYSVDAMKGRATRSRDPFLIAVWFVPALLRFCLACYCHLSASVHLRCMHVELCRRMRAVTRDIV